MVRKKYLSKFKFSKKARGWTRVTDNAQRLARATDNARRLPRATDNARESPGVSHPHYALRKIENAALFVFFT